MITLLFSLGLAMAPLPDYVVLNDETCELRHMLTEPSQTLTFPLSKEDWDDIATLETKYDQAENCAGLAAVQIGIHKRIVVLAVKYSDELKKWRPDLTDALPKSIWINPTYTPLTDEMHTDYEGCFSVNEIVGEVPRYKSIRYEAFTPEGQKVTGVAHGFLARLIQHEIDHTNGFCFVHRTKESSTMTKEEYQQLREQRMTSEE